MLSSAKPTLQSDLEDLLEEAAYEAFMTTQESPSGTASSISNRMEKELKSAASNFAKKFAEVAGEPMAEAIYNFVKEIGIIATPSGSLISTSITSPSPVTGTMPMSDFAIY